MKSSVRRRNRRPLIFLPPAFDAKFQSGSASFGNGIMIMKGNRMFAFQKKKHLLILSLCTVIVSACGSSTQNQANISTAVAQTVAAQDSLTKVASLPTPTTAPSIKTTVSPDVLGT